MWWPRLSQRKGKLTKHRDYWVQRLNCLSPSLIRHTLRFLSYCVVLCLMQYYVINSTFLVHVHALMSMILHIYTQSGLMFNHESISRFRPPNFQNPGDFAAKYVLNVTSILQGTSHSLLPCTTFGSTKTATRIK